MKGLRECCYCRPHRSWGHAGSFQKIDDYAVYGKGECSENVFQDMAEEWDTEE